MARLNFLAQDSPDLQYPVKEIARDSNDVTGSSWIKVKHLIKYLRSTIDYRQTFKFVTAESAPSEIDVYADTDWAGCHKTRRSTSGYAIMIHGNVIHTASKTQGSVAMSS